MDQTRQGRRRSRLAEQPKSGAPLRLSAADRQKLPGLLERGAESFGFRGDLWTCARVGKLIEADVCTLRPDTDLEGISVLQASFADRGGHARR